MQKIIVLTGPTASGKTELSLKIAHKFDCEIISADSRQVYRGLDIGTDKIKDTKNIPHHLIDIANPKRTFTVAQWQRHTEKAIKQITKHDRVPLIVGGTAFYIESLIFDKKFPEVKPDRLLRNMLRNKASEELLRILKKLDPARSKSIDQKNKVRLVRAIEIAKTLGKVPVINSSLLSKKYSPLVLGLKVPNKILQERIDQRVDRRFNAIVTEINGLRSQKLSFKRLESLGLEYRYVSMYIQGKMDKNDARSKLKTATRQFAKRQKTFFKRLPVVWIKSQHEAETKIKEFLKN